MQIDQYGGGKKVSFICFVSVKNMVDKLGESKLCSSCIVNTGTFLGNFIDWIWVVFSSEIVEPSANGDVLGKDSSVSSSRLVWGEDYIKPICEKLIQQTTLQCCLVAQLNL